MENGIRKADFKKRGESSWRSWVPQKRQYAHFTELTFDNNLLALYSWNRRQIYHKEHGTTINTTSNKATK